MHVQNIHTKLSHAEGLHFSAIHYREYYYIAT